MNREELAGHRDVLLEASRFRDYCPNGLQVEGRLPLDAHPAFGNNAQLALRLELTRRAGDQESSLGTIESARRTPSRNTWEIKFLTSEN